MKAHDIAAGRLHRQQLGGRRFTTPKDVVAWMGAMQSQELIMARWAVGARMPGATETAVEAALAAGEIIRMHLLRPTWHFVAAEDAEWMRALTAPRILSGMRYRHAQLGLTDAVIARSLRVVAAALGTAAFLTREQLADALRCARIPIEDGRLSHLLMCAELKGIACSGPVRGSQQSYALFESRVPPSAHLQKDEALSRLALRYFHSRGPATLDDFIWWSGMSVRDAKRAVEIVRPEFETVTIDARNYLFSTSGLPRRGTGSKALLLPAFDEFIIGYQDRSDALTREEHAAAVSRNGVFHPVVVLDHRVAGTWRRAVGKERAIVEIRPFRRVDDAGRDAIAKAAHRYAKFLEKPVELIFKPYDSKSTS
jgi:hypothetical protein